MNRIRSWGFGRSRLFTHITWCLEAIWRPFLLLMFPLLFHIFTLKILKGAALYNKVANKINSRCWVVKGLIMAEFGDRLRAIRSEKGVKQEDLAENMGLTQASISQFEKGQRLPTPALIEKFAEKLGVTREELSGLDNGAFEKKQLMRNLDHLSPDALAKINHIVEMIKNSESSKRI